MNIRIDEHLKLKGDSAFEAIGWTPSQAARALWEFASRNIGNPQILKAECARLSNCEDISAPNTEKDIGKDWTIVSDALSAMGIDITKATSTESDDELRDRAMLERLTERGLL